MMPTRKPRIPGGWEGWGVDGGRGQKSPSQALALGAWFARPARASRRPSINSFPHESSQAGFYRLRLKFPPDTGAFAQRGAPVTEHSDDSLGSSLIASPQPALQFWPPGLGDGEVGRAERAAGEGARPTVFSPCGPWG